MYMVARKLKASWGRSGKQQQEQTSLNHVQVTLLGPVFSFPTLCFLPPSPLCRALFWPRERQPQQKVEPQPKGEEVSAQKFIEKPPPILLPLWGRRGSVHRWCSPSFLYLWYSCELHWSAVENPRNLQCVFFCFLATLWDHHLWMVQQEG